MKNLRTLVFVILTEIATARIGVTQVIYDSSGFEPNRFSSTFVNPAEPQITGDLAGQDALVAPWSYIGPSPATTSTGTAQVIVGNPHQAFQGTQSVFVTTGTANDSWGVPLGYDATGKTVAITWDMAWDLFANNGQALNQETDIGINVFGLVSSTRTLIAGAGIDARTTQLFYFDGSDTPQPVTLVPNSVGVGFHQYQLDLDYASQTYQLFVDGNASVSTSFVAASSVLSDVDISTWVAQPSQGWGGAYFDNLVVSVVPEPTLSITALALPLFLLGRRRDY